jgi:pre-mRNA-splicing factor ATP-dependent RNA helicase DHX38/PRP16
MAWDATPQSVRETPSMRVPNVGWDSTPRDAKEQDWSGWGAAKNRRWDAPTPRAGRDDSPEGEGGAVIDIREWEEEQTRLDRDWYTGAEDGTLAGDEEHNPLAQYEDLSILKQAEIAKKQTVSFFTTEGSKFILTAL